MAKKETAEEKLLKIIEATKKAKTVSSAAPAAAPMALAKHSTRLSISVQQINLLLMVGVLASLLFLGYEVKNGLALLGETVSISVDTKIPKDSLNLFVPQMKGISYYLDKASARNLFKPYELPEAGTVSVTSARAALEKKMAKYISLNYPNKIDCLFK